MPRIRKKHLKSILAVCAAAVLFAVGSTVAFFSSRDEITNRFAGGRFDIILSETKWDPNAAEGVVPGDELPKNPQVTNNEKTPGYIFLRVTVPCDATAVDNDNGTPMGSTDAKVPIYKFMVSDGNTPETFTSNTDFSTAQTVNGNWKPVLEPQYSAAAKTCTYVYAYTAGGEALAPLSEGATTEPLFDRLHLWNFNENIDEDHNHSVLVEAFGIQSDLPGFSADQVSEIWQIVSGGGT